MANLEYELHLFQQGLTLCGASEAYREILKLRESLREMRGKLQLLVEAVDPFLADQGGAADSRCGLVQPVSVAECNELNEAVKAAWELLERT